MCAGLQGFEFARTLNCPTAGKGGDARKSTVSTPADSSQLLYV